MNTTDTLPRQKKRQSTAALRKTILQSSLKIFTELGYEAATTRKIASEAGVEQGHLAYYFKTKEELWKATVSQYHLPYTEMMEQLKAPNSSESALIEARKFLYKFLQFFSQNRSLSRMMNQEFAINSDRKAWLLNEFGRQPWLTLKPLFHEIAANRPETPNPAMLYFSFMGGIFFYFGGGDEIEMITGLTISPETDNAFIKQHIATLFGT